LCQSCHPQSACGSRRAAFESNRADAWIQKLLLDGLDEEGWLAESQRDWAAARRIYEEAAGLAPSFSAAQADRTANGTFGYLYRSQGVMLKRQGRRSAACEMFARAAAYYKRDNSQTRPFQRREEEVAKEVAACGP
jgi:tetratricopeptide (TPR) repeat protein